MKSGTTIMTDATTQALHEEWRELTIRRHDDAKRHVVLAELAKKYFYARVENERSLGIGKS
jgi:hypothetical protein